MDLFSTNTLVSVIQDLKQPSSAFLDRYFPTIEQNTSEEIHFDRIDGRRRIAPFVSPLVEGKVVASQGRKTDTFSPAYIKDKRVFDPSRALKRAVGERIGGGELSPEQRMQAHLAFEMADQVTMLNRRLEIMAVQAIRLGQVTVVGDGYPSQVVDFLRPAANSIAALTGTAAWSNAAGKPLANLRAWSRIGLQGAGVAPVDVIMGTAAFEAFADNPSVSDKLKAVQVTSTAAGPIPAQQEGLTFMGTFEGFNVWVYAGWYVDPADNTEKEIFPANEVVLATPAVAGVRAFGAIRDEQAGYQAMPYFPKSWTQEDPAVRFLMLQSAPLTVPLYPAATVRCVNVIV